MITDLNRAAALIRERAQASLKYAGRDLWADMATLDPDNDGWIVCEQRQPDVDWDTTVAVLPYDYEGHGARHIASWHPVVALAVADWLDAEADSHSHSITGTTVAIGDLPGMDNTPAMRLARTYLGEPA